MQTIQRKLALAILTALGATAGAACSSDPCDQESAWSGNAEIKEQADLEEMEGIQCITGSLVIGDVEHDPALTGSGVQDFALSDNIVQLDGLSDLEVVEGDIHIAGIVTLLNLEGLSSLTHVGRELRFEKNPRGDLIIHQNPLLRTLDGLDNLYLAGGNIIISHNEILNDISSMTSLERVGWELKVINNPRLDPDDVKAAADGIAAMGGLINDDNGTELEE